MSRIGKKPIAIPSGVKIALSGSVINVEGPKGKLSRSVHDAVSVEVAADQITVSPGSASGTALQGLTVI